MSGRTQGGLPCINSCRNRIGREPAALAAQFNMSLQQTPKSFRLFRLSGFSGSDRANREMGTLLSILISWERV